MTQPTHRSERGFWYLTALQFQGAFSDNLFRISLMLIAAKILADPNQPNQLGSYNAILQMLFPASYLIFSVWAGFLADRYSKRFITIATKVAEVVLMTLAAVSFIGLGDVDNAPPSALFWPTVVLFFMFTQSAFFSPSKYGIIPELVDEHRLGWANGIIGLTTYLAIIIGAFAATALVPLLSPSRLEWIPGVLIALAVVGLLAGRGIDRTPEANPGRPILTNPIPELIRYFRTISNDHNLLLTVLGLTYFWGLGSLLMTHVVVWSRDSLGYGELGQGLHFVLLALGIGVGSALAGRFSRNRIEVGLVPLGALVMGIFSFPMAFASPQLRIPMALCLVLVAMGGGFFSVPLNALLQKLSDARDRGGILAATNYATNIGILFSGFALYQMNQMEMTPNSVFVVVGAVTLAGTVIVIRLTPEALLRFIAMLLTTTIYRIRTIGLEKFPATGGVLILSNHVSYVDALLLGSITSRPVRFVAYAEFFRKPILGWFLRTTRSIPIASTQRPRELKASLQTAAEALRNGEVVCVFAEGQLTRTGQMLPFNRGYELILREFPAPILPVYLDGVWGSVFSYERRRFFWKWPRRIPYTVRVAIGDPLPADTPTAVVRQRVQELGADAAHASRPDQRPLQRHLIRSARRHWRTFAMVDTLTPPMRWGRVLTGSVVLARRLAPIWGDQRCVGILLPPSVGAALINYAAALTGRTTVNLNYTIGQEALNHCARQSGLKTIVTSRRFVEKVGLELPAEVIYMEDLRTGIGAAQRIAGLLAARFLPARLLERYCRAVRHATVDDIATIIFSSGSTGTPKGVPLSHFNIVSNVLSFSQAVALDPRDRLLGTLPFFHSFGFTVSLWGGSMIPFGSVFHFNPLDVKTIGDICEKHRVSLIITTPTFLQHYTRRISPRQMGGVNLVVAGAERLPEIVAHAFEEQFGVEPLQGYGTTECSPVVSVNINDHRSPGFRQVGNKRGSVGHPLPGIAVRTVDPATLEPLPPGQPGLLEVRGANVMSGYLDMPEKTAEVLRDGWYNTGDMAFIDDDGFIFITGRLSRFSKIGGEMVPHVTIEDRLHELMGFEERRLAVTSVPDEKKGEQLVVLHTLDDAELATLLEKLPQSGMPNIFIPRAEHFFRVEELPVLGSGKLNLRLLNELATEFKERKDRTEEPQNQEC